MVLVLADPASDAAEGGPGILGDGGLHVGGGGFSLAGSLLHDHLYTCLRPLLHAHSLEVNRTSEGRSCEPSVLYACLFLLIRQLE